MLIIELFELKNLAQLHVKVLKPNKLIFFDMLIPFAIANDPLSPEKFPGP